MMLNRGASSTVHKYPSWFLPKQQFSFLLWSPAGRGPGEATNHWSPGSSCSITELKVLQSALISLCKVQQRFSWSYWTMPKICQLWPNKDPPLAPPMAVVYQSGFSLCCPHIPISCWSRLDNLLQGAWITDFRQNTKDVRYPEFKR